MLQTTLAGRYKVIEHLGGGGFAQTYLAKDKQLPGSPLCVVKQHKPQNTSPANLGIARRLFDNEARILYKLGNHKQIPRLLAHFEENQEFYLVQEFIEGDELSAEFIIDQPWSNAKVITLLEDVLTVLAYVHQQGVIHRDLKPSNLIRRKQDEQIVLIDFGAVKQISTQLTNTQVTSNLTVSIGTIGYMPSEQSYGKPKLSSDIYALGIICIQALTGLEVTELEEDPQTGEIIWREEARVHPGLANILETMVRYDFRERYESATQTLAALENFRSSKSRNSQSVQASKLQSSNSSKAATSNQNSQSRVPAKSSTSQANNTKTGKKSNIKWFIFGGLLLMGLGGFLGIQFYRYLKLLLNSSSHILTTAINAPVPLPKVTKNSEYKTPETLHTQPVDTPTPIPNVEPSPESSPVNQSQNITSYQTLALANTLQGHSGEVNSVAISPDGITIVSGGRNDQKIKLWNRRTGAIVVALEANCPVSSLAITANGETLIAGCEGGSIKMWNFASGELIRTFQGHGGGVTSLAINPDGQTIASGSTDRTIRIWNLDTGALIRTIGGHSSNVNSIAISPDGKTVASASSDNTIKIWDVSNGELIHVINEDFTGVSSLVYSPDGKTLVSNDYNKIKIWNLSEINKVINIEKEYKQYIGLTPVVFSPDGQTLAVGGMEVTLYSSKTGKKLSVLEQAGNASSIAFSADGYTLIVSIYDTIKVWRIPGN